MDGVGQGKHRQPAADHQNGVQAVCQIDPVDQLQHQPAAAQTDNPADTKLTNQLPQQAPVQAGFAAGEHVDQGHGQENRHRVVTAGFDFQAGGDPFVQAFAAQQREDRRSIGGANNGADQQALNQIQIKQPCSRYPGQPGGDQYTDRCQ